MDGGDTSEKVGSIVIIFCPCHVVVCSAHDPDRPSGLPLDGCLQLLQAQLVPVPSMWIGDVAVVPLPLRLSVLLFSVKFL